MASPRNFADLVTYTRSGTATRVNSIGLIESVAADRARLDHDPSTLALKGLLIEEARTNLLLRSEELDSASWAKNNVAVSANAASAPDGTTTADRITGASAGTNVVSQSAGTSTANETYGYSLFAKADDGDNLFMSMGDGTGGGNRVQLAANLTTATITSSSTGGAGWTLDGSGIVDFGGGWYRIYLIGTVSSAVSFGVRFNNTGGITAVGDDTSSIFVWGAQLEAGASATSYIPTTTATATRNADDVSITGTNFSDWFNASEGTVFVEAEPAVLGGWLFSISDGTTSERIASLAGTSSHSRIVDGGAGQTNIDAGDLVAGQTTKVAHAFKANDFAACVDGGTVATDTSGTLPTVDRMFIGADAVGTGGYLNGHIKNIRFYPSRLTDAELQALTT